jgi:hypothetical protein
MHVDGWQNVLHTRSARDVCKMGGYGMDGVEPFPCSNGCNEVAGLNIVKMIMFKC